VPKVKKSNVITIFPFEVNIFCFVSELFCENEHIRTICGRSFKCHRCL